MLPRKHSNTQLSDVSIISIYHDALFAQFLKSALGHEEYFLEQANNMMECLSLHGPPICHMNVRWNTSQSIHHKITYTRNLEKRRKWKAFSNVELKYHRREAVKLLRYSLSFTWSGSGHKTVFVSCFSSGDCVYRWRRKLHRIPKLNGL